MEKYIVVKKLECGCIDYKSGAAVRCLDHCSLSDDLKKRARAILRDLEEDPK